MYTNINYFKSLNTLRFIAAYFVLIHHSESMKAKNGIARICTLSFFENGSLAVNFFFVLSGFLITYFLLKEKKRTKNVEVRKFYLKRILRIYPLYYLLIVFGTVIVPFLIGKFHIDYDIPYTLSETWYYFVFFLPILVTYYHGHHLLEPLWSIGVEEIFYLFWAPLFKFVKRNILSIFLIVIGIKIILSLIPYIYTTPDLYNTLIRTYNIESMAIGGLGAYILFNYKKNISHSVLYKPAIQYFIYMILLVYLFFDKNISLSFWHLVFKTPIVSGIIINILFLYLIIGVSVVENSIINLENRIFSYFGKISYGIYMYHTTVISMIIIFINKFFRIDNPFWQNVLFYLIVTIGVILVSHLSYKYFESMFFNINRKRKLV